MGVLTRCEEQQGWLESGRRRPVMGLLAVAAFRRTAGDGERQNRVLSSHTQLSFTHSLSNSLKLCSWVFIGCLLEFDFKKPLSHFFAARKFTFKEKQLTGKNVHFGFTNITRFELYVFVLVQS